MTELRQLVNADNTAVVATSVDAIMNPDWSRPSPLIFPIDPWLRAAILESSVVIVRAIDASRFNATRRLTSGEVATLSADAQKGGRVVLSVTIGNMRFEIGSGLTDRVTYRPIRFAALKDAVLTDSDNLAATERQAGLTSTPVGGSQSGREPQEAVQLAPGDDVAYATVYRGHCSGEHLLIYKVAAQSPSDVTHVVWNIAAQEYSAIYREGTRIDLDPAVQRRFKNDELRRAMPPAS